MATNKPQDFLEWQMHCVLKNANLLQYYDNFVREGECDVLQLTNAEDEQFKDVMEKVGMARKPLDVHQFRNILLEWMKNHDQTPRRKKGLLGRLVGFFQKKSSNKDVNDVKTETKREKGIKGKNEHVPFYTKQSGDDSQAPGAQSLMSNEVSGVYSGIAHMKEDKDLEQIKGGGNSVKKELQPQQDTKSKQTRLVVKDQKQHGLVPYYNDLLDNTILDKMVLDNLISRCILMIEDREEIIKPTTQRERNRVLLDILIERPYGTMEVLMDVLQEADPLNSDVQEIFDKMQCTENTVENISCHDINVDVNDDSIRIQKNYKLLVQNIVSTTDVTDYLIGEDILQHEEREEVCASGLTTNESNRRLLNKLMYKSKNGYYQFLKALQYAEYNRIAHEVSHTEVTELDQKLYQIGITKFRERRGSKKKQFKGLKSIRSKNKELASTQEDVIPKHILEQFERRLEQWKKDDTKFVNTEAKKQVIKAISRENCITIIGNSGTGKSFLSRHVALTMMEQGYMIIPCDTPGDIRQWFKHGRKTVFVFDDVCGRYTLNQQILFDWKQRHDHITSLLKDNCCKIMSTCRLDVYKEEQFRSLTIFKMCQIDLNSQKYRLNDAEKMAFAEEYFPDNANIVNELSGKYDFFPLLCSLYNKQKLQNNANLCNFFSNPFNFFKDELVKLYIEDDNGKLKYCSLVLIVMLNNTLTEEMLSTKNKEIGTLMEDLFEECELNKGISVKRLTKSIETLEGTYVVKNDRKYKIIHDKLFDFLAKYFGENMLQLFIYNANTAIIRDRFIWETTNNMGTEIEFAIKLPDNKISKYIDRLQQDWEVGFVDMVFENRNMTSSRFTEMFINSLNKLDQTKQEKLACTQDIESKDIALGGSCYMGNVDLVKWLISRKSDINYCIENGTSPLLWASQEGHVDVVKELLQHSANINKCMEDGTSPLQTACYNNAFDVVKVLLQYDDVKIDLCDNDEQSSLYLASKEGHLDIVKELLQHTAEVNKCKKDGRSPLYEASQNGYVDLVKELLQHSANVNKCIKDGTSPLKIACYMNNIDVVKVLLQCDDINIDLCDNEECSSLYWASEKGHVDVVNELLQHSSNVNKCKNDGGSPLYIASLNGHLNIVKQLLQRSANVNKCMSDGTSSLQIACFINKIDIVKILLKCPDVNIDLCDNDGRSSLYWASQQGHVDVVKELLKHSANVNHCRIDGSSPLQIACYTMRTDVVKELLKCDEVEIDHCDNDCRTSLYLASRQGHVNVVKELLQHLADVNICDAQGKTPLCLAQEQGHVEVEALLSGKR